MASRSPHDPNEASPLRSGLEFTALTGFAISPLYDLLGRYPEVLVANDFGSTEIFVLCLVLSLAVPAVLAVCEAAVAVVSAALARSFHVIGVGLLAGVIALPVLSHGVALPGAASIVASGIVAAASMFFYTRWASLGGFLRFISPLAAAFPAMFLMASPARDLVTSASHPIVPASHIARPAPILLVVMDEFPLISLLDASGAIDAERYPEFAEFAAQSTWYPNATTDAASTMAAVPTILTGRYPTQRVQLATFEIFPDNIFSLLSDTYTLHSFEAITQLCPTELCAERDASGPFARVVGFLPDASIIYLHRLLPKSFRNRLPSVSTGWKDFVADTGQPVDETKRLKKQILRKAETSEQDLEAFLSAIEPPSAGAPTFHFFHMLKPHSPFRYLPSGRSYPRSPNFLYGAPDSWGPDPWESTQAWQRHLLQVGYVDRQLGKILDRLREVGLYDEALIAIVADHGLSFLPGSARRLISAANQGDIVPVPFLLKLPHQQQGQIDPRGVATVDLLVTIADAIGAELPWPTDGRSALTPNPAPRGDIEILLNEDHKITLRRDRLRNHRDERLARKIETFGSGNKNGKSGLFQIGFAPELIGKRLATLPRRPGRFRVQLRNPERFMNVDRDGPVVPVLVVGGIAGPVVRSTEPVELAIAVNGEIQALTKTYARDGAGALFEAMIPESALRNGRNAVNVLVVSRKHGKLVLESPMHLPR